MTKRLKDERGSGVPGWFIVVAVVMVVIGAMIWLPALNDCNSRGGVLQENAFGLPGCVASQEGL
jgi:hypothetical protein